MDSGAVDTVIIAKLDRLTRSVADLAELLKRFERRGVSLVSVADSLDTRSAAGRLVLNIMVLVSQWEREAIGERTRDAMHHKRENGERVGTVPFGYRMAVDGVHIESEPAEQAIAGRIREMKAEGFTLREIAAEQLIKTKGLPELVINALSDAAFGYRVQNATYRVIAEVADAVASRDLKSLVDNGLLAADGEKRGRAYIAAPILKSIRERTREPGIEQLPLFDR